MAQRARRNRWVLGIAVLLAVAGLGVAVPQPGPGAGKQSASRRRDSGHDAERKRDGEAGREPGEKEADDPAEATRWFLRTRSPDQRSPIDVGRYAAADLHARGMPRYASATGQVLAPQGAAPTAAVEPALSGWTALGPGNIGGRVRSLVIDPITPSTMYAGGVDGGVWKTTDSGGSWRPTADFLPSIAVASLVMDPTDHNVLYAGTGEGQYNGDAVRGEGILRTADGGTTWQRLPATASSNFYYVNAVVVSPNDHRRVYAGTKTGIWRSTDSGTTWSSVWAATDCLDVQVTNVSGKDLVLGSCGSFLGGSVVRTTDGGAVTPAWTSVLTVASQARTSLAFAPSGAGVVYALLASTADSSALALYRSNDSGATWSVRSSGGGAPQIGGQGWYDNTLAVDPADSNRIWVGFQNTARSTDGGATWTTLDYFSCGLHPDQHRIVFPPNYDGATNKAMYIANDGGVFRTTNARGTPNDCDATTGVPFTSLNHGLAVTQFYDGAVYPDGKSYFGGAQDNGTSRGTDGAGPDGWSQIVGADGGYVEVDPTNTQRLYAEIQGRSLLRSEDGGSGWTGITNGLAGSHFFISPFVTDPRDARTMWSAGDQVYRSTDAGDHWVPASSSLSVSALAVAPHDSNTVIVGSDFGAVYRNSQALQADGTTTWQAQTPAYLGGNVSSVAFDPSNQAVVYATVSQFGAQHVWRSTDGGATFVSIDGTGVTGLPDIPVNSIAVDPADGRRLYVGTDLGVFVSLDTGATWAHEVSGFPNALTVRVRIQGDASGRTLFAFTHGRGAWRVPLGMPARPINDDFASLTTLSDASGSLTSTTAAATRQAGEPTHAAAGSASIWYRWVAPKSGQLTVDTSGSSFDTLLGAYTGSTVGALTQLAANDNVAVGDTSSRISIPVTGGTAYAIAVDGRTTATGTVGLRWSFAPKSNDAFATAEVLSGNSGTTSASNTDATLEPSEPQHWTPTTGGHSIWYRFTATAAGTFTVNTSGSNFDTVLAVYQGSSLSSLTKLGANDDFDALQSRVGSIPVAAGTTYAIAVDGYGGNTGTVNLQWAFRTVATALEPAPGRLTP